MRRAPSITLPRYLEFRSHRREILVPINSDGRTVRESRAFMTVILVQEFMACHFQQTHAPVQSSHASNAIDINRTGQMSTDAIQERSRGGDRASRRRRKS